MAASFQYETVSETSFDRLLSGGYGGVAINAIVQKINRVKLKIRFMIIISQAKLKGFSLELCKNKRRFKHCSVESSAESQIILS